MFLGLDDAMIGGTSRPLFSCSATNVNKETYIQNQRDNVLFINATSSYTWYKCPSGGTEYNVGENFHRPETEMRS